MQRLLLACTAAGALLSANVGFAASDRQTLIPPSVPSFQSGQAPPQSGRAPPPAPAGQSAPAATAAPQQPAQPTQLSHADQAFVAAAAQNSMVQLQDAQLATQRAASPQVRQLAQRLVTDQTAANDALQQIAQQHNLTLPAQPSPIQAAQGQRLTPLYGQSFDSAFLHVQVLQNSQSIGLSPAGGALEPRPGAEGLRATDAVGPAPAPGTGAVAQHHKRRQRDRLERRGLRPHAGAGHFRAPPDLPSCPAWSAADLRIFEAVARLGGMGRAARGAAYRAIQRHRPHPPA